MLRRTFDRFDKDGSGTLTGQECYAALISLGSHLDFDVIDQDGDGNVEFSEFKVLSQVYGRHTHSIFRKKQLEIFDYDNQGASAEDFARNSDASVLDHAAKCWRRLLEARDEAGEKWNSATVHALFRKMDGNGNGKLSNSEIRQCIKELVPLMSQHDISVMLATADRNKDGYVTAAEFEAIMLHNYTPQINAQNYVFGGGGKPGLDSHNSGSVTMGFGERLGF